MSDSPNPEPRSPALPLSLSAVAGLIVCLAIMKATGKREAWDSAHYFTKGIPIMCAASFALAYFFPSRPWRWTLSMAAGQAVAMAYAGGSLSLWPLSLIAMTILSVPQLLSGMLGSRLGQRP